MLSSNNPRLRVMIVPLIVRPEKNHSGQMAALFLHSIKTNPSPEPWVWESYNQNKVSIIVMGIHFSRDRDKGKTMVRAVVTLVVFQT